MLDVGATLDAVASIIVAGVAIIGLGGTGVYMARRRANGQPALPGSAHDEQTHVLRDINKTLKDGFAANSKEHKEQMDILAPRPRGRTTTRRRRT